MPPKKSQTISDVSPSNIQDNENQFENELFWCIRQLELGLCNQKPDSRQATEAIKILKILKSDKAPLVKKRQAMRNTFGDYRQKIKEEEKKNAAKMKKLKVTPVSTESQSKSVFYKKSLKKADESYVAMMASVNVNSDQSKIANSDQSKTVNSDQSKIVNTDNKPEAQCGFKFGFPDPCTCEEQTEPNSDLTDVNISDEVTCPSHDINCLDNDQGGKGEASAKFVMPKSDNSFRFNFDIPP